MAENESISPEDMKLFFVTDAAEGLVEHIKIHAIKKFGLVKKSTNQNGGTEKTEENFKSKLLLYYTTLGG